MRGDIKLFVNSVDGTRKISAWLPLLVIRSSNSLTYSNGEALDRDVDKAIAAAALKGARMTLDEPMETYALIQELCYPPAGVPLNAKIWIQRLSDHAFALEHKLITANAVIKELRSELVALKERK